jgi:lambda repressor-like predicted transcriptional regulator
VSNDQLRIAIDAAGLTVEELADQIPVDVKTVRRWLAGRVPYPRYRNQVAALLGRSQHELWPEQHLEPEPAHAPQGLASPTAAAEPGTSPEPGEARSPDAVDQTGAIAERGAEELNVAVPDRETEPAPPSVDGTGPQDRGPAGLAHYGIGSTPSLRTMFDQAGEQIDLLDTTLEIFLSKPGVLDALAAKANAGSQVRILISDAHAAGVQHTDEGLSLDEPDQAQSGAQKIPAADPGSDEVIRAHQALAQLIGTPGIEIRTHTVHDSNAVYRLDDHMLIILNLQGVPATHAPKFIATRGATPGMFDPYMLHFETLWQQSPVLQAPLTPSETGERDDALQRDPAYQLALYEAKAALQADIEQAHRHYQHTLEDVNARHRSRQRRWPTWSKR